MTALKIGLPAFFWMLAMNLAHSQVINYVENPGFETTYTTMPNSYKASSWESLDSAAQCFTYFIMSTKAPIQNAPYGTYGFQFPRSGSNFILSQFYCDISTCLVGSSRGYPRNRLKQRLKPSTAYCVTYFLVNTNNCPVAIDAYGVYFGSTEIESIKNCATPATQLVPQIENIAGNVITDTLRWIPMTGTFVATGTEKYMVLGNFKSNANTSTLIINQNSLPSLSTDLYIDDVSVIELNLQAFAGDNKEIVPGDSVFLGRQPDIGINEACTWYKLPNDSVPIDTIAGFWVKPVSTCTYIVRQEICGNVKWDTVVLYENPVGVAKWNILNDGTRIYPNPAKDFLDIEVSTTLSKMEFSYAICSCLGSLIREEEITLGGKTSLDVSQLDPGVYTIVLKGPEGYSVTKKFVIAR